MGPARKSKAARRGVSNADSGPAANGRHGSASSHRVHHWAFGGNGRKPHAGHEAGKRAVSTPWNRVCARVRSTVKGVDESGFTV